MGGPGEYGTLTKTGPCPADPWLCAPRFPGVYLFGNSGTKLFQRTVLKPAAQRTPGDHAFINGAINGSLRFGGKNSIIVPFQALPGTGKLTGCQFLEGIFKKGPLE
jgi:hypothetical protein